VDVKTAEGLAVVQQLATDADVFIENFMPGKLDEVGLGWNDLRAINPRLVYETLCAFQFRACT
jgi:crotonobetainyl-CoA:carnitine CoA-transferase CaiB-like acyl-CoA transferase